MFNLCLPDAAAPVPPSCAWRLSGHIGWYLSESVWAVDQHAVPHTSECASAGRWRPTVATPDIPRIWEESQGGSCSLSPTFLRVKLSISVGRLSLCYGHGLALYWHPVKIKCICICILHATSFRNRGNQKEANVSLCIQIGVKYFIAWLFLMALQYRSSLSNHTFTGLACWPCWFLKKKKITVSKK